MAVSEYRALPNRQAPLGSGIYYALRFAARPQQFDQVLANSLIQTLREIPSECSEPLVAREKLAWWQQELERATGGAAGHPLARDMGLLLQRHGLDDSIFLPLFKALAREIGEQPLPDQAAVQAHCRDLAGLHLRVLTRVAGGDEAQIASAEALGQFVCQVESLRNLGRDLRRGHCLLPADLLRQQGLTLALPIDQAQHPALASLLQQLAISARRDYAAALNQLPAGSTPALGVALSLAAIAAALLRELEREGFQVIERRTSLTPLHKLWLARSSHRQARAGKSPIGSGPGRSWRKMFGI